MSVLLTDPSQRACAGAYRCPLRCVYSIECSLYPPAPRGDCTRVIVQGLLDFDPFDRIDEEGVGSLVKIALEKARAKQPETKVDSKPSLLGCVWCCFVFPDGCLVYILHPGSFILASVLYFVDASTLRAHL